MKNRDDAGQMEAGMRTIFRCHAEVPGPKRWGVGQYRRHQVRLGEQSGVWLPTGEVSDVPPGAPALEVREGRHYAWCAECKRGTWYQRHEPVEERDVA